MTSGSATRTAWLDSPAVLLVMTGSLLGLTFPFGKLATDAAVSPLAWAWLISAGAGCSLLLLRLVLGKGVSMGPDYLRYYLIAAPVSLVIPNFLIFLVIPQLGSGFTSILFTLSPIITLLLSSIWKVRMPGWSGLLGIVIGFAGAVVVTSTRGELTQPAEFIWILAGLCIPASLAIGNIYRTLGWPVGADPMELAIGTNLAAAGILFIAVLTTTGGASLASLSNVPGIALAQVVSATAMFSVFFRLQQVGGPTYLSQIGYVGAGVALLAGTVFLHERYALVTWFGAAVIAIGIGFSVFAQRRHS